MTNCQKAVFLDRDGVLNHSKVLNGKPYAPKTFKEFRLYKCAYQQLSLLKKEGFKIIVVTNQPDVGNGKTKSLEVKKMHQFIKNHLPIDQIKTCFHSQNSGCSCRKPLPGMLFQAAVELEISASKSFIIGDRYSDIEAGVNFGCKSILIDRNYLEHHSVEPWKVTKSLTEAVTEILKFSSM